MTTHVQRRQMVLSDADPVTTILARSYDLIEDKDRWTMGCSARDEHGIPVEPASGLAVKWCGIGAIAKVSSTTHLGHKVIARRMLEKACRTTVRRNGNTHHASGGYVNDVLGHDAILEDLSRAMFESYQDSVNVLEATVGAPLSALAPETLV